MNFKHVFIGLGSNRGSRQENIQRALDAIAEHPEIELCRRSTVIETEPWGVDHDRDFLNCVIECRTNLNPPDLLDVLQQIETDLGREHRGQNRPRIIDLDILYFGNRIVRSSDLQIPHPKLYKRKFVLKSLCELEPEFIHPKINRTNKELLDSLRE